MERTPYAECFIILEKIMTVCPVREHFHARDRSYESILYRLHSKLEDGDSGV